MILRPEPLSFHIRVVVTCRAGRHGDQLEINCETKSDGKQHTVERNRSFRSGGPQDWNRGERCSSGPGLNEPARRARPAIFPRHYVESRKCLDFSALKRPTISTLFQRPSEGVDNAILGSLQAATKKLMAFQTTKGVTATTHAP